MNINIKLKVFFFLHGENVCLKLAKELKVILRNSFFKQIVNYKKQ